MSRPDHEQTIDLKVKKRPKQARAQATFTAMLDACIRVLCQSGYAGLTTNRVADVAGVSIGSLYEYFPNKQALVAAALGREIDVLTAEVLDSLRVALALEDQPRAGIDHWIRAMTQALQQRSDLLRIALREVPFLWRIPEMRQLAQALLQIAREGQNKSRGVVELDDPEASTWLLMTMVWGAIVQNVLQRPRHLSADRITSTLVEMLLKLIR